MGDSANHAETLGGYQGRKRRNASK
jgi:hypothetical protein